MPVMMSLLSAGGGSGGGGGISGGLQALGGAIGGLVGLGQRRKAKKMLNSLVRPTYSIPKEILRNQKQAELSAQEGMPSAQYNRAMQNIQRQQSNSLKAAQDRRSAMAAIAANQQAANDAMLDLDVADAQQVAANRQTLYNVGGQTAAYRDRAFDINQMQPYNQKRNYAMSLMGAGNQNIMGGLDRVLGGVGMMVGGGQRGQKQMTSPQQSNNYNFWEDPTEYDPANPYIS